MKKIMTVAAVVAAILVVSATAIAETVYMRASGSSGWTYGEFSAKVFARSDAQKEGRAKCAEMGPRAYPARWEEPPGSTYCSRKNDAYGGVLTYCTTTLVFECRNAGF